MTLRRNMRTSFGSALLLLALSVACTVHVKDEEFCVDAGPDGATCFHSLSDAQRDVPKASWDIERFGQICETPQTFADWKSVIDSLCQNTGDCTYKQAAQVKKIKTQLGLINQRFQEITHDDRTK